MHRDIALALLPNGAPTDIPSLMARIIIAQGTDADETPIPLLQASGFTGAEIAQHMDAAKVLVESAFNRCAQPGPYLGNLTAALSQLLTASPELTQVREAV